MNESATIIQPIEIQPDHEYKDERGTVWRNPVSIDSPEGQRWDLYTGSGPLTRRCRFDRHGHSGISTIPNLVLDLGERITSVVPAASVQTGMEQMQEEHNRDTEKAITRHTIAPGVSFPHALYDQLLEETIKNVRQLGQLKGGEYAGDTDRLANFRRNADRLGLKMEQVWAVYANKHIDAINQYVHDLSTGTTRSRLEGLAGRADDVIVYMTLFKAMLIEAGVK